MPIRAILNNEDILSVNYTDSAWDELKKNYRESSLVMPCCDAKAIPKVSKRGVQFFAHSRKGNCTSAPESAEHIYLKSLVTKIALSEGWDVVTEKRGETSSGEVWIADVYCTKGTAKLVIEIQCSYQTEDEFIRRQKKYAESGVRCAWLFKRSKLHDYPLKNIPQKYDTPVFSFQEKLGETVDDVLGLVVTQFGVAIEDFVQGLLTGRVQWYPMEGVTMEAEVIKGEDTCGQCDRLTGFVSGINLYDHEGHQLMFVPLRGQPMYELVAANVNKHLLYKHEIGEIKVRKRRQMLLPIAATEVRESKLSSHCIHCGSPMGNTYIDHYLHSRWTDELEGIFKFPIAYKEDLFNLHQDWRFDGYREVSPYGKIYKCRVMQHSFCKL